MTGYDSKREAAADKLQEPVAKKWILHESFADVASFDAKGFPALYWKESVAKFKDGELSTPCKGKNCGSLNGWLHSAECRAEHEAQYTTPPQRPWVGLTVDERDMIVYGSNCDVFDAITLTEDKLKEKNNG